MNYTDAVREYCYKHKNEILEVAKMKEFQFDVIPYKTLLRIMNRLEEEQIITGVSKDILRREECAFRIKTYIKVY